jgi:hypothetical protein
MTALGMLLAGFGIVLLWAAISNRNPKDIIGGALHR